MTRNLKSSFSWRRPRYRRRSSDQSPMVNPHDSSGSFEASSDLRPVRRFMVAACIVFASGVLACIPGVILLNQQVHLIPVDMQLTGIEYNGTFVSAESVMLFSLVVGACGIATAGLLAFLSRRNSRLNRETSARPRDREHSTSSSTR